MTTATKTTISPLVEAMRADDRRANTGPDDEDYAYYGPILRGAPMFTAADIAALRARVAELEAALADVTEQRDYWRRRYEYNTTDAYNARITEALNRMRENEGRL